MNNIDFCDIDLTNELSAKLAKYRNINFSYMVIPRKLAKKDLRKVSDLSGQQCWYEKYPIFSTEKNNALFVLSLLSMDNKHSLSKGNPITSNGWFQNLMLGKGCNCNNVDSITFAEMNNIMIKHNIKSCFSTCTTEGNDDFVGVFFIYSESLTIRELIIETDKMKAELDTLHFYITRKHCDKVNPSFYNGQFKEKMLKIIELTAKGKSSGEISAIIPLSSNGVNYHLEKAKSLLDAKNKVELIYKAKASCLI